MAIGHDTECKSFKFYHVALIVAQALKKEKKRLKKEAKHERRSGSHGAHSPSRSSGSDGDKAPSPALERRPPPPKQAPLDLRELRQKALENAMPSRSD